MSRDGAQQGQPRAAAGSCGTGAQGAGMGWEQRLTLKLTKGFAWSVCRLVFSNSLGQHDLVSVQKGEAQIRGPRGWELQQAQP